MQKLKAFAENPWLNLVSDVILLLTAGNEALKTLDGGEIDAHHRVAFSGLVKIIQCLPHILHGTEQVSKINGE